ncbi:MAG: TonB-dependent receptor [Alphaproteobacteria bacterium]|nr:TonB-dependent receptor [Alphaproteobacteria bacterium]
MAVGAAPATAEEEDTESEAPTVLPDVVVTATRIATPKEQIASSMTVITAEDIERRQYRSIGDALRTVPSLSVIRNGGPGKNTAIFSRGSRANHTLILLDGIEMNDPSTTDGRMNFASVPVHDVERIEILHGPQGTLYGSDAIGAVINIITKRGSGPAKVSLMAEAGSFDTFNQALSVRGSESIFDYSVSLDRTDTDGISVAPTRFTPAGSTKDDDGLDETTFSANLGVRPSDILSLRFTGRFTDIRNDFDLNVFPIQADNDSHGEEDRLFLGGNAKLELFEGRSEHRLAITYTDYNRITRDDLDAVNGADFLRDKNLGEKLKFELQNDFRFVEGHIVTIGLETEEDAIETNLNSTSAFGPFSSSAKADVQTNAIYVQDQIAYDDRFFGTVGLRIDDHDSFGSEMTYRFAPAYLHRETGTKLRGAYAKGFKAPALVQLFGSSISGFGVFTGNPDLKPEVSRGWEVGFDQSLYADRITVAFTYYDNEIKNLISSTATTNVNLGVGDTRGIEIGITAQLLDNLELGANYAYTRAEDGTTGQELLRRPLHKGGIDLAYRPIAPLALNFAATYIGVRHDIDALTFGRIKDGGYVVADLAASYDVAEGWQAFGRIENLFSKHYEDPDGFEQPGFGFFLGVRKTLEAF